MAHEAQQEFCLKVKSIFPEYFKNVDVCDIGSLDINGNNHYLFEDYSYVGVDIGRGKNVNVVSKGHEFRPINGKKYDVVMSTECFEHDMFWDKTFINMCENLVKPGGLVMFTCATTGRQEHGTRRTQPTDSPFTSTTDNGWEDYYLNLAQEDFENNIKLHNYFCVYRFYTNDFSHDLYFWGIAK